jgi:hypothetical protein
MAFAKKDIEQTMKLIGLSSRYNEVSLESIAESFRQADTPCNCCFIGFDSYENWSKRDVEVLFAAARIRARDDGSPTFGLSVTEREPAYKAIMEYIKDSPRFQTITTGSRHGRYKVVWVIGRADGRAFPQPKTQRPVTKESLRTGKK